MTDSEYIEKLFYSDSADKKRTARGSRNKVGLRNGMKTVSDYMTAKEVRAMSGEPVSVNLSTPLKYDELVKVSIDTQKEYITGLVERYGAPYDAIAEMLGISQQKFAQWRQNTGFRGKKGRKVFAHDEWLHFLGKDVPEDIQKYEDIIMAIVRSGVHAKITIEFEV